MDYYFLVNTGRRNGWLLVTPQWRYSNGFLFQLTKRKLIGPIITPWPTQHIPTIIKRTHSRELWTLLIQILGLKTPILVSFTNHVFQKNVLDNLLGPRGLSILLLSYGPLISVQQVTTNCHQSQSSNFVTWEKIKFHISHVKILLCLKSWSKNFFVVLYCHTDINGPLCATLNLLASTCSAVFKAQDSCAVGF